MGRPSKTVSRTWEGVCAMRRDASASAAERRTREASNAGARCRRSSARTRGKPQYIITAPEVNQRRKSTESATRIQQWTKIRLFFGEDRGRHTVRSGTASSGARTALFARYQEDRTDA